MKWRERLTKEAVNGWTELRGVESEFDESLTMKSENCSINCQTAINISSSEMGLDNDVSNEWDTKGDVLFLKLEYSWFIILYWFLLYSRIIQLYTYIYIHTCIYIYIYTGSVLYSFPLKVYHTWASLVMINHYVCMYVCTTVYTHTHMLG